jgi:hypothetical protein
VFSWSWRGRATSYQGSVFVFRWYRWRPARPRGCATSNKSTTPPTRYPAGIARLNLSVVFRKSTSSGGVSMASSSLYSRKYDSQPTTSPTQVQTWHRLISNFADSCHLISQLAGIIDTAHKCTMHVLSTGTLGLLWYSRVVGDTVNAEGNGCSQ